MLKEPCMISRAAGCCWEAPLETVGEAATEEGAVEKQLDEYVAPGGGRR